MRIAFVGKGGSGKTTIAAAFASFVSKSQKHTLVIDGDINMHMTDALSLEAPHSLIGDEFFEILDYFTKDRNEFKNSPINKVIGTIPPSKSSSFVTNSKEDPFLKKYAVQDQNISLLTVGSYNADELANACFHGKLNSLELLYHHLLDKDDEVVIADSTAGIDNLATSLYFAPDINVFVVEPTAKSIAVYKQFKDKTSAVSSNYELHTKVIINKYDPEDADFINQNLPKEDIVGYIPQTKLLKSHEQGNKEAFDEFILKNKDTFMRLSNLSKKVGKRWSEYLSNLQQNFVYEFSRRQIGTDANIYIDPDFKYEEQLQHKA